MIIGGNLYTQSHPSYSSKPVTDLVNPGLNLCLYSDIVPIFHGEFDYKIKKNVDLGEKDKQNEDEKSQNLNIQSGSGINSEDLIDFSFNHPKRIKTETVRLPKQKTIKRQSTSSNEAEEPFKKPKLNGQHKFQLI